MSELEMAISYLATITSELDGLKAEKEMCEAEIIRLSASEIQNQLSDKDYGAGTANIDAGQYALKVVLSKNVKWDQAQLENICAEIAASGEDPKEFVKVKYDVSETAYKSWPSRIRGYFEPARTVELSKPKISFERKGE